MQRFFKREEKKTLPYAVIEERKQTTNYTLWIVGVIIIIVVALIIYILLNLNHASP